MNQITPQDMRRHLMLNQSRLSTADEVAQEIEDYWDATDEFSRDDKNQAGFVVPVGEGPAKGGKPNGVPYNCGKGSGTKGKGKIAQRSVSNPSVVNSKGLVDTVNGVGGSTTKKPSVGFQQEYLKSNPSQDAPLRDTCEWSNTSEKGQGHSQPKAKVKVKARAGENTQEKGTTTRTRLDLRLKMSRCKTS